MKLRTVRHIIKEGVLNSYRNKLMSLASVSVVSASLIVFGIFLLVTLNLNHNVETLRQEPEMEAFCKPELDDSQVAGIEELIKANEKIQGYTVVTKKEAFEKARQILGNDGKVLEGEDESFMPVSFIIKLKDPQESLAVAEELKNTSGIGNVTYSRDAIQLIEKVTHWISLISSVLLAVLLLISVFIISNTIKLTVFARRKEISIMKYIGGTDWFIRWPFIVEGVIIGFIGAVLAFVLIGYGYNALESRINLDFMNSGTDAIKIMKINDIGIRLVLLYLGIGIGVGASGSLISIRKYLHV